MNEPIFIVGANRSGTTLLRLILNAHSRLAIPEEIVYFGSSMAGVPIEKWRSPGLSDEAYNAFVHDFVFKLCAPLEGINQAEVYQQILNDRPGDFRKPYKHILEYWSVYHGKKRWGEKTPGNLFYADVLIEMFPRAKFIHLVRDPRAGVSSMMKTSFFPKDIVFNAMSRHKFMTKGRSILEQAVPEHQRTTLRYEDLVLEPEKTVRAICNFIEETFEEGMMSFYQDSRQYMKRDAAASFNKEATKPISADMLDKWRKVLRPEEVALVQHICKNEMREFGYDSEKVSLSMAQRRELFIKRAYWNLQEFRNRDIRHFTVKSPMFARIQNKMKGRSRPSTAKAES